MSGPFHLKRAGVAVAVGLALAAVPAAAQAAPVDLGTAKPFAVLGGQTVTNTGPSVLNGELGVAPGTALTGFELPAVVNGAIHNSDAVALQAQSDLTAAYNSAAGQPVLPANDLTGTDLGNRTLKPGAYKFTSSAKLTGPLTLDAEGDPNAQFVFEITSALTTAPAVSDDEAAARVFEDHQDAEVVRVAAYAGLRRGELVALRWRDVDFARRKLVIRRAVSGNVEASSTKSRRAREVPLPDQAAGALDRLSQRFDFTSPDDYVFANRLGRRLDGSALRRRVERARNAASLRPLRFHDLRHTYGSLLVAGGVDLASVKAAMGHSRITTTERYLHARSASELADRFTRALAPTEAVRTPSGQPSERVTRRAHHRPRWSGGRLRRGLAPASRARSARLVARRARAHHGHGFRRPTTVRTISVRGASGSTAERSDPRPASARGRRLQRYPRMDRDRIGPGRRSARHTMSLPVAGISFEHDEWGDVLYLSVADYQGPPARAYASPEGHAVEYDGSNYVIALTLVNVRWLSLATAN